MDVLTPPQQRRTSKMRQIIALLERYIEPSLIKYYLVGGVAVAFHLVIVVLLVEFGKLGPTLANAIAFILATIFSNIANTYWSFQAKVTGRVLIRFWLVALIGLCLAILISSIANHFQLYYLIGSLMVVSVTPLVSYTLHKNWTYK